MPIESLSLNDAHFFSCSDCIDRDPECAKFAWRGECESNPFYMNYMCPQSCQVELCANSGIIAAQHIDNKKN